MNRKILLGLIPIIVIIGCTAIILSQSSIAPAAGTPRELDFTVSGKNACLRFLNDSVSVVYVPIATGANENWELTINATNMAGGAGGWVDLYVYEGYWDGGANNTCLSKDMYPILANVVDAEAQLKASDTIHANFRRRNSREPYAVLYLSARWPINLPCDPKTNPVTGNKCLLPFFI